MRRCSPAAWCAAAIKYGLSVSCSAVEPGLQYGSTDDYGYYAVENKVHFHDLHATILHYSGSITES